MRVLHVYKAFTQGNAGGVERSIVALAAGMSAHGFSHRLFTLAEDGPWERAQLGGDLIIEAHRRTGVFCSTDFSLAARQAFTAAAQQADIVHYHLPWPFVHVLDAKVPRETPRVATYHAEICRNPLLAGAYRPLMMRFIRRLDAVIATSAMARYTSKTLLQVPASRVHVAELGLDLNEQTIRGDEDKIRALADCLGEGFMLFVGVTRHYKGVQFAIDALQYTNTRLVVAGDAPNLEALQAQAEEVGVADRVCFLGRVSEPEKWALLRLCRALVLPSNLRAEGFGLVLVEAAAAGRPSITCELGTGTSHVVVDEQTGLVVEPANAEALGVAMQRFTDDPELARAMGQAGRQRYERHFTAERYGSRVSNVYEQVLGMAETATAVAGSASDAIPQSALPKEAAR